MLGDGDRYMDEIMLMARQAAVLIFGFITGCALPQIRPNSDIKRLFGAIDTIQTEAVGKVVTIEDRETIDRIRQAYGRSKWDPMPTTMPLDLVTIFGIKDGQREFKLLYGAGWIIDTDLETGAVQRLGTLTDEDREWMHENIRLKLPRNPGVI
jgi:hypothetical protein